MAETLNINLAVIDNATAPMKNAQRQVQSFSNQTTKAGQAMNNFGKQATGATRLTKKFAMSGLQQAGYQVGDFFVQVGAGTSKLQAFGQQGSQLLGIFGPVGAVLGAGVAIVAALGNALSRSTKQATDFAKATEKLATATSAFDREIDLEDLGKLEEQYGNLNDTTIKLINSQRILAATQEKVEFAKVTKALTATAAGFDKVIALQDRLTSKGVDLGRPMARIMSMFEESVDDLATRFGVLPEKLTVFGDKLKEVASSKTRDDLNTNITNVLDFINANGGASTEAMIELKSSLEQLAISGKALEDVKVELIGEGAKEAKREIDALEERAQVLGEGIGKSFGSAFTDIVKGTKSTSDAFKSMAASIVDQLFQVLVVQQLVGMVGTGGKGSGSGLSGAVADFFRADGGPVSGGKPYVVGERGPELFVPGSSGTVIPNKNMSAGGGTTVVQNINISTGVSQTVRAEVAQMMPQIAEASKAAVLDARRRGGSFSKAF